MKVTFIWKLAEKCVLSLLFQCPTAVHTAQIILHVQVQPVILSVWAAIFTLKHNFIVNCDHLFYSFPQLFRVYVV